MLKTLFGDGITILTKVMERPNYKKQENYSNCLGSYGAIIGQACEACLASSMIP